MDQQIRTAAFIWLEEQTNIHGDVLPWEILHKGFDFMGQRGSHRLQKKKRNCKFRLAMGPGGAVIEHVRIICLMRYILRYNPYCRNN